jgi:hypothetical protein
MEWLTFTAACPRDADARVKPSVLLLGRAPVVHVNDVEDDAVTLHSMPSMITFASSTDAGRLVPAYVCHGVKGL